MRDDLHEDLFANHAWQEMRKVLDREMPERKRRGFFWLWLLPALGMCTLLCRDSLLTNQPQGLIPQVNRRAQEVVAQQQRSTPTTQAPPNPDLSSSSSAQVPRVASSDSRSATAPSTPASALPMPGSKAKNEGLPRRAERPLHADPASRVLSPKAQAELSPVAARTGQDGEATTGSASTTTDPQPLQALDQADLWPTVATIASRQVALVMASRQDEGPKGLVKPVEARKLRPEWWIEGGSQFSNGVQGLSGYRLGVTQGLPLWNKSRLWLGLAYEVTQTSFLQLSNADTSLNLTNTPGPSTTIKVGFPVQDPQTVSAGRQNSGQTVNSIQLQFLSFNAAVFQPLSRRVGLAVGGNLHYLQGIKFNETYLRSAFSSQAEAILDRNFTSNANTSESISKSNFRNFGFSAQAGVVYQITPRWSGQVSYRQSLQHFTKSDDLLLQPCWLDFGLRYRIR